MKNRFLSPLPAIRFCGAIQLSALWSTVAAVVLTACGSYAAEEPINAPGQKFANYTQKIPGTSVSFDMVAIPGGEITVGSPANEPGREAQDLPQTKATIKPFWMSKTEVPWEVYILFVYGEKAEMEKERADGITRPTKPYGSVYRDRGEKGYPAIGMSQHSADFFTKWLGWKTRTQYRLPTEAEWEYACRAGATNAYFWGDDPGKAPEYAWYKDDAAGTTHLVAKKLPNKFGLYDMLGNVAEWCAKETPDAPSVVRGGGFTEPATKIRCASRMIETAEWNELDPQSPPSIWWLSAADFVGIRLVRPADDVAKP